ncbi:hypothetical protein AKJ09_08738 [Labilithrix luteola]|uniref:Uncharacterized protein n=1 Tax=Labilithrix luteola TaxID=1391654 RepID=A0A0K1Q9I0_9BACT|nr:hypothetical protein AKJ09_08738 [Labilithrix luteola]
MHRNAIHSWRGGHPPVRYRRWRNASTLGRRRDVRTLGSRWQASPRRRRRQTRPRGGRGNASAGF